MFLITSLRGVALINKMVYTVSCCFEEIGVKALIESLFCHHIFLQNVSNPFTGLQNLTRRPALRVGSCHSRSAAIPNLTGKVQLLN